MSVRHVVARDVPAIAQILVEAFRADPYMRWQWRDDATYDEQAGEWFAFVAGRLLLHGQSFITEDGGAAGLFVPPDVSFPEDDDVAEAASIMRRHLGPRADEVMGALGVIAQQHPPDRPHVHCVYIGTRDDARGRGLGAELMHRVTDVCDTDGLGAFLVSTNPRNLTFYRRAGYEVFAEVTPDGAPTVRPMWRDPR